PRAPSPRAAAPRSRRPEHCLDNLPPYVPRRREVGDPSSGASGYGRPGGVRTLASHFPVTSPSSSTIECVRCHTPLPDNSKFCFACGADQTGGGAHATTSGQVHDLMTRLQRIVEGKYKLERLLGKGGMGAVFLAQDLTLD